MRVLSSAAALGLVLGACQPRSSPVPEAWADDTPAVAPSRAPAQDGVAVVELFTSEGCSSCPAADDILGDLARSPGARRTVFTLAFHVDYWDDLGWPDRFASPELTARQRAYARAFGLRGMYTPQMVVGGAAQFTGSDRASADAAIAQALARSATVHLSLRAKRSGPGAFAVDWTAAGAAPGELLNVALVEGATSTAVRAGENSGKTLHHASVVRAFVSAPLSQPAGTVTLALPAGATMGPGTVVAFAQRPAPSGAGTGMPVDGATSVALPE